MVFNSLEFVVFFIVVTGAYALLGHRNQNRLLLVASYVFYGAWDYRFLALLWLSTIVDYVVALWISAATEHGRRKRLLWVSIAVNLGILGFFKYFDFFTASMVDFAAAFGVTLSPVTLNVILPVGISFYTFQSLAYTIDVYRGTIPACRRLSEFALYIAFFPQLVAGPIERAKRLLPQIAAPRTMTAGKAGAGLYLVLRGLFKKVVVADNLALLVDPIFAGGPVTGEEVIVGSLCFGFQIYCDFSGYSDIARGLARILGFELVVNFRQPFFATNPAEFLRRWHVSLSAWLRDYLFRPLGGIRRNHLLTIRNITITMVLAGLWHGAAWNFVLWGVYISVMLMLYRSYDLYLLPRVNRALAGMEWTRVPRLVLAGAIMLIGTTYAAMIFRSTSLAQIVDMTTAIGDITSTSALLSMFGKFALTAGPIILLDLYEFRSDGEEGFASLSLAGQTAGYVAALMLFLMVGVYDGVSFIYFQF